MSLPEPYAGAEARVNAPTKAERLDAARTLARGLASGEIPPVPNTIEVNNHVHTIYSFSPHSPTSAAWYAMRTGLQAVGIMDHDTVAGVDEMLQAGSILGIATTAGFEIRANFSDTPFAGRIINGPGMPNLAYIAIHGIPATQLARCQEFLHPFRLARNRRNAAMVDRLNGLLHTQDLPAIDYQRDVYAQSTVLEDGTISERHILAALSNEIMDAYGKGERLVDFLEGTLGIGLAPRARGYLLDAANPHYLYDLLGVLKAFYTDAFFIQPDETECPNIREVLAFSDEIGAISAYCYLGDVTESPTGDKKAEKFEDDFLDELMPYLCNLGFRAVTYMPPRNNRPQLERIRAICDRYGLMQISGVDINSSRQVFNCPEILDPLFANLITATWALIGHEKLSTMEPGSGLFGARACAAYPVLEERLAVYARISKALDPHAPTALPAHLAILAAPLLGCTAAV